MPPPLPPPPPPLPPPPPPRAPPCIDIETEFVVVDIVLRDFTASHPDFNRGIYSLAATTGMVSRTLDANGKPLCVNNRGTCGSACPTLPTVDQPMLDDCNTMDQWFNDVDGVNMRVNETLILNYSATMAYESSEFFPLDNRAFNEMVSYYGSKPHNFFFTTEIHIMFAYRGQERFQFSGDDDVYAAKHFDRCRLTPLDEPLRPHSDLLFHTIVIILVGYSLIGNWYLIWGGFTLS